jgi:predicted nucleic acid-binding protein
MCQFASAEDDRKKVVSALASVEGRSGICRLRREKSFTSAEASVALVALADDLRRMIEQPVTPPVLEAANGLVDRYVLRALDAVHLGAAIVARDLMSASDMRFIASDHALLRAAHEEGFETWDPAAAP